MIFKYYFFAPQHVDPKTGYSKRQS